MENLLESIGKGLSGEMLQQIAGALGTSDQRKAGLAANTAVSTLLGALARNASSVGGASALHGALSKDHDGSILGQLGTLFGNPTSGGGDSILRHVLGGRRAQVENRLGQATGVGASSMGKLLTILAPVVLGYLGKTQRQEGMNAQALAGYLGQQRNAIEQSSPQVKSMFSGLLDTDGDGDLDVKDWISHGTKLFGKFLQ